jgi:flavin reductase (DIM6/NTAB) family NADH-FMN oxidoreductase RutF
MELTPDQLPVEARYKLLTGTVIPRPIAVVSTVSPEGTFNAAPFSYFNIVGHAPMAVSFVVAGPKPDGTWKDTLRNAQLPVRGGTGEFVVNNATEHYAAQMARTASPLAADVSEFDFAGLTPVASKLVRAPRIGQAAVAFECRTLHVVEVGRSQLVIGEIVFLHLDDAVVDEHFRVDFAQLRAIGRMAGSRYARTSDTFVIEDEKFFPGTR